MFLSCSPLPNLRAALMLDTAAAFFLDKVLVCILGSLSIIDGSIVKTLPDPGMCVREKKKSIMAHSICYSVYILKDRYLNRDFNVSINVPKRSLGGVERLSLLDSRGNLTHLCSTGSCLPDSTSLPRLLAKNLSPQS